MPHVTICNQPRCLADRRHQVAGSAFPKCVEDQEERPEVASNAVKLQRPAKGHCVQSLQNRI